MPKRKPPPSTTDTYGSDGGGGFIDDGHQGRKTKKVKGAKNGGGDKDGGTGEGAKGMGMGSERGGGKEGGKGKGAKGKDDEKGEVFWELTSKRRVGIAEFKGVCMVNIREYYEKDGETLPGKKGISLPIEQFNALIKVIPDIETVLAEKGQSIQRPDYSGAGASAALDDEDEEDDEDEVEKTGKKNFEETSDDE